MSALGGDLTGLNVLDLFSGSGALGFEALSRGASRVVFVETSRKAHQVITANTTLLGCREQVEIVVGDALAFVAKTDRWFEVALADPPYSQGYAEALAERYGERPFADELWLEHRSGERLPDFPGMKSRRYGDTVLATLKASLDR